MDQFSELMEAEFQRRVGSIPVAQDRAVASVRAGIRRRRTVRAVVSAAGAVVLVGAVGAGSYGVYSHYQADPAIPVSQSPTPEPTEGSATPTPTPSVTPSPAQEIAPEPSLTDRPGSAPVASVGDKAWLADRQLPPLLSPSIPSMPYVRQMEPWIWDNVGVGWSLVVSHLGATEAADTGDQRLILLSPDGEAFQVWDLRDDLYLTVDHWRADSAEVWINRGWGADTWQTAALSLVTGDPVAGWGDASDEQGVAMGRDYLFTLPDGRDVWSVTSYLANNVDVVAVNLDGSYSSATGLQAGDDGATLVWFAANGGSAVVATSPTAGYADRLVPSEASWFTLDTDTWTLSPIASPNLTGVGALGAAALCGRMTFDGQRVLAATGDGCVTIDVTGFAPPVAVERPSPDAIDVALVTTTKSLDAHLSDNLAWADDARMIVAPQGG